MTMSIRRIWFGVATALWALVTLPASAAEMQRIDAFAIDRTEVTIGAFRTFVGATGAVTKAERDGGGFVYEGGWQRMPGWTWKRPYGRDAAADEPAVHITYDEAEAFCRWAGKRLPTDAEWIEAAYVEHRTAPSQGFETGRRYPYPTGTTPNGANCLSGCGTVSTVGAAPGIIGAAPGITRGRGHAKAGSTKPGVNGLTEMAANVWEWTETGDPGEKGTRGGSWWYGPEQMKADSRYTKPRDFPAVYIGFRCVKDLR